MSKTSQTISKLILDTLFPIRCLGCSKEGSWICESCKSKIFFCDEHVCGVCEKVQTPDGRTCVPCKRKAIIDGLIPAAPYSQAIISSAIHLFKYRFIPDLHVPLGQIITSAILKTEIPLPDIIIPIPLHQRRLRWRGFNQSSLLASYVSTNLLPLGQIEVSENTVIRNRYTPPQMKIASYASRKENIVGAFSLINKETVKNKNILLIDDVATTGSTIFECSKLLKSAGAKEVYAAVIARQETRSRIN